MVIHVTADDEWIVVRVMVGLNDVVNLSSLRCPPDIIGVPGGLNLMRVINSRIHEFGFEMVDPGCK